MAPKTPKKRKTRQEDDLDEEERYEGNPPPRTPSMALRAISRNSTSEIGAGSSRTDSIRMQMRTLGLRPNGFIPRQMDPMDPEMPKGLREFLKQFVRLSNRDGIISDARKPDFEDRAAAIGGADYLPGPAVYALATDRDKLGPTPSFDQALSIMKWARQCRNRAAEEAEWNSAVHFPLLRLALHGGEMPPEERSGDHPAAVCLLHRNRRRLYVAEPPEQLRGGSHGDQ